MSYKILNPDGNVRTHAGQEVYGCDMVETLMERAIKDPGKRLVEVVTSADTQDRDGDRIRQEGIDHSYHMGTKSVLYAHDYGRTFLPIGKILAHQVGKKKESDRVYTVTRELHQFNPPGTYEVSDAAWKMVEFGSLNATSIGFIPKTMVNPMAEEERAALGLGPRGIYFEAIEKLETSWVPVPSNRDAIREAFGKGVLTRSDARILFPTTWHEINAPSHWVVGVEFDEDGRIKIVEPVCDPNAQECEFLPELDPNTKDRPDEEFLSSEDHFQKPYENEHSCRINDPGKYDRFARKNCEQKHDGKCIDVIYGIKGGKSEIAALRYPKDVWTAEAARNHCKGREGIEFEPAKDTELEFYKNVAEEMEKEIHRLMRELRDANNALEPFLESDNELMVTGNGMCPICDQAVVLATKAGAVLNRKNKENLQRAQELIQDVLNSAETQSEEEIDVMVDGLAQAEAHAETDSVFALALTQEVDEAGIPNELVERLAEVSSNLRSIKEKIGKK